MAHGWVHLLVIGGPITGWASVRSTRMFSASFLERPSKKTNKQTNSSNSYRVIKCAGINRSHECYHIYVIC